MGTREFDRYSDSGYSAEPDPAEFFALDTWPERSNPEHPEEDIVILPPSSVTRNTTSGSKQQKASTGQKVDLGYEGLLHTLRTGTNQKEVSTGLKIDRGLGSESEKKAVFGRLRTALNAARAALEAGLPTFAPDGEWGEPLLQGIRGNRYRTAIGVYSAGLEIQRGDYKAALRRLDVLKKFSTDSTNPFDSLFVRRWISTAKILTGDYLTAITELEELLETRGMGSYATSIIIDMADANLRSGRYQKALSLIHKARETLGDPTRPDLLPELETKTLIPAGYYEAMSARDIEDGRRRRVRYGANDEDEVETRLTRESILRARIALIQSKTRYMWGLTMEALPPAKEAWALMVDYVGPNHVNTLECAAHYAICLAHTFDFDKAHPLITEPIVEVEHVLHSQHPVLLELWAARAHILMLEWRPYDAVGLLKSVIGLEPQWKTMPEAQDAQQYWRLRHLLGEAYLAAERPDLALNILLTALSWESIDATQYGRDTAGLASSLALAHYQLGQTEIARRLARRAMSDFALINPGGQGNQKERVPPSLLQAMRIIALMAPLAPREPTVPGTLQLTKEIRARTKLSASPHSPRLMSATYDLALAYRRASTASKGQRAKYLKQAAKYLRKVSDGLGKVLGGKPHSTLYCARRELICTEYWEMEEENAVGPRGKRIKDSWAPREQGSNEVFDQHFCTLGAQHEETLRSLLWLIAVLLLRNKKAEAEWRISQWLERVRQGEGWLFQEPCDGRQHVERLKALLSDLGAPSEDHPLLRQIRLLLCEIFDPSMTGSTPDTSFPGISLTGTSLSPSVPFRFNSSLKMGTT
ncbi:hypothetical protein F5Y17DRAFT_380463 [Xylariaceae sp. FL0594]|nr:hypothetical protein F5Y17DRAFT_380463 [Xylariaceae sp. FL0594]